MHAPVTQPTGLRHITVNVIEDTYCRLRQNHNTLTNNAKIKFVPPALLIQRNLCQKTAMPFASNTFWQKKPMWGAVGFFCHRSSHGKASSINIIMMKGVPRDKLRPVYSPTIPDRKPAMILKLGIYTVIARAVKMGLKAVSIGYTVITGSCIQDSAIV